MASAPALAPTIGRPPTLVISRSARRLHRRIARQCLSQNVPWSVRVAGWAIIGVDVAMRTWLDPIGGGMDRAMLIADPIRSGLRRPCATASGLPGLGSSRRSLLIGFASAFDRLTHRR